MDYSEDFKLQFSTPITYHKSDTDQKRKLQDARQALQEATSEITQLEEDITALYEEARIENVATTEMMAQITSPLFKNMPLPRNADGLSLSEKAGYVLYYLKFLGYSTRRATEEYHTVKDHLDGMYKSVTDNTVDTTIKRSGKLRIPELDGKKEMKRSVATKPPPTPPATPTKGNKK